MKFEFSTNTLDSLSSDIALVFTFSQKKNNKTNLKPLESFKQVDSTLEGQITNSAKIEQFTGKKGELLSLIPQKKVLPSRIIVLGLGNKKDFETGDFRKLMGAFAKKVKNSVDSVSIVLPSKEEIGLEKNISAYLIYEGLLLGAYTFGKYKKQEKSEHTLETIIFAQQEKDLSLTKALKNTELYYKATRLARDLVNEQPAIATPTYLANLAKDIAKSSPLINLKIIEKAEAEKMGMEAFLGVARASDTPPKFIVLDYKPKKSKTKDKWALIGKGITFDSGGINVKPGDHMMDMKMDMSGAATVLSIFSVIGELQPEVSVMGVIAATPNLISGKAIVPGDVVKAYNGKTIEILNTDAEGRVTMADSLSYAVKQGATKIVDLATLTGACMVALGEDIAGLFSNNKELTEQLKTAAEYEGEMVWEMPLPKEYKKMNKSDVADIANIPNSRYGGAITAALFLEEFVNKKPWAHLDIAGPAFASKPSELTTKGGTGFGVRLLLRLFQNI